MHSSDSSMTDVKPLSAEANLVVEAQSEGNKVKQFDLAAKNHFPKQPIAAFPSTDERKFLNNWDNK